jgi:MFS family permease
MQMAGLAELAAWRWIFIMEGILTCILAVVGFLLLVSFPQDVHKSRNFLSIQEIEFVLWRIEQDRQDVEEEPFTLSAFMKPALEWKVWGFAIIFLLVKFSIIFFSSFAGAFYDLLADLLIKLQMQHCGFLCHRILLTNHHDQ